MAGQKAGRRTWVLALLVAALALVAVGVVRAQVTVPDHLDIQSATIVDPPWSEAPPLERAVRFEFVLTALPDCQTSGSPVHYGFLIDADADPSTGADFLSGFDDLGVEAQVRIECDPATGGFTSEAGTVTVDAAAPAALLVEVPVSDLPALEFTWAAYAQDLSDGTTTRFPDDHVVLFRVDELGRD